MRKQRQEKEKPTIEMMLDLDAMPLETLKDHKEYNRKARILQMPIKIPPRDLLPHQKVVFQRKDQPHNALPVKLSTANIDFEETLHPGQTYNLPVEVINFLNGRGTPVYKEIKKSDGTKEAVYSHDDNRFQLQAVFDEE